MRREKSGHLAYGDFYSTMVLWVRVLFQDFGLATELIDGLVVFGMLLSLSMTFYFTWWLLAAYLGGAL